MKVAFQANISFGTWRADFINSVPFSAWSAPWSHSPWAGFSGAHLSYTGNVFHHFLYLGHSCSPYTPFRMSSPLWHFPQAVSYSCFWTPKTLWFSSTFSHVCFFYYKNLKVLLEILAQTSWKCTKLKVKPSLPTLMVPGDLWYPESFSAFTNVH